MMKFIIEQSVRDEQNRKDRLQGKMDNGLYGLYN